MATEDKTVQQQPTDARGLAVSWGLASPIAQDPNVLCEDLYRFARSKSYGENSDEVKQLRGFCPADQYYRPILRKPWTDALAVVNVGEAGPVLGWWPGSIQEAAAQDSDADKAEVNGTLDYVQRLLRNDLVLELLNQLAGLPAPGPSDFVRAGTAEELEQQLFVLRPGDKPKPLWIVTGDPGSETATYNWRLLKIIWPRVAGLLCSSSTGNCPAPFVWTINRVGAAIQNQDADNLAKQAHLLRDYYFYLHQDARLRVAPHMNRGMTISPSVPHYYTTTESGEPNPHSDFNYNHDKFLQSIHDNFGNPPVVAATSYYF